MKPRIQKHYEERVRERLMEEFGYPNLYRVPKVDKIVINVGVGEAPKNPKLLDSVVEELGVITGQRPIVTRARKAISNFAIREGMPIGAKVTLRQTHMYEFLDRLVSVAIPRIRDFRGLSTRSFDGRGNYTLGIKEQVIFPEIEYDRVQKIHGMDIVICTTAERDDEALALLREMGMPFRGESPVVIGEGATEAGAA